MEQGKKWLLYTAQSVCKTVLARNLEFGSPQDTRKQMVGGDASPFLVYNSSKRANREGNAHTKHMVKGKNSEHDVSAMVQFVYGLRHFQFHDNILVRALD